MGSLGSRQKHSLPDLSYDYGALEPHINAQIMQLHHSKHHAAYVNNLNTAEEKYQEALAKGRRRASARISAPLVTRSTSLLFRTLGAKIKKKTIHFVGNLKQASIYLLIFRIQCYSVMWRSCV